MKNIVRYSDFINESVDYKKDLKKFPEIIRFIEHLIERTYELVEEYEYNVFLYVKRSVNNGMYARIFEYIIRSGADDVIGHSYIYGEPVIAYVKDCDNFIYDIDIRDNWGVSLPSDDPKFMELHDVLHYEFPKFNIM